MHERYLPYSLKPEFELLTQERLSFEVSKPKISKRRRPNYIKWVQTVLNQALGVKLGIDGERGSKTRSAIRSFQRKMRLSPDGIVGTVTEQALIKVNPALAKNVSGITGVTGAIPKSRKPEAARISRPAPTVAEVGVEVDPVSAGTDIIKTIFSNEGDIKWELDQMREPKHPSGNSKWGAGVWTQQVLDISQSMSTVMSDEISAKLRIRYQYNGHSVGNFYIEVINTEDAAFWGLNITAKIRPDQNDYIVNGKQPVALVLINYNYRFDHFYWPDKIFSGELKCYGTGDFESSGSWTQW